MSEKLTDTKESFVETGRTLEYYTSGLFFEPKLLQDKKVLNLGSGSSHLGKDLEKKGVDCKVVDLDLTHDPYVNKYFKPIRTRISKLIDSHMTGDRKRKVIRKIMGIEGRKIVQADMGKLPFPDQSFDVVFAYYSTYQLPSEKKLGVFSEMLRVANAIHLGPILKEDLYFFVELLKKEHFDFEIVLCYPPPAFIDKSKFMIKKDDDYQKILNGDMGEDIIWEPQLETISYKKDIFGRNHANTKGGYTIILKRKESL